MQRLQSPPLYGPPNGLRCRAYRRVDGGLECGISPIHNHAGKTTQNHFDQTPVIDATFRPVDVGQAHGDSFNRGCELPKPHPKLSCDIVSILLIDGGAQDSYMCRWLYLTSPSPYVFGGTRH